MINDESADILIAQLWNSSITYCIEVGSKYRRKVFALNIFLVANPDDPCGSAFSKVVCLSLPIVAAARVNSRKKLD